MRCTHWAPLSSTLWIRLLHLLSRPSMPPRYAALRQFPLPGGPHRSNTMIRDNFKRHMVAQEELNRTALKYIARNTTLPMRVRIEAQLQLTAMPNYTRPTQIRDRCVESGYARSNIKEFRVCRVCYREYLFFANLANQIKFRELALKGELPGVRKASW